MYGLLRLDVGPSFIDILPVLEENIYSEDVAFYICL